MEWKIVESQYLYQEPWLTIRKDKCQMPNGKIIPAFYVNEYPEWVNALAFTREGKIVMVKQYRHGIGQTSMELPGGVAEEGETMEEAVRREMREETGYEFGNLVYLGKISANPSTTNNFMHMFVATECEKTAEQELDETEELEVHLVTLDELKRMVRENRILQSLHVNCIMYALLHLGELKGL
jgi:ADP-ribose pyrophosphatase